ncbi:hypothetical protein GCM10027190_44290 [Spirosoma areae]
MTMKAIKVPTKSQMSKAPKVLFDQIQKKILKVSNLYGRVFTNDATQAFSNSTGTLLTECLSKNVKALY